MVGELLVAHRAPAACFARVKFSNATEDRVDTGCRNVPPCEDCVYFRSAGVGCTFAQRIRAMYHADGRTSVPDFSNIYHDFEDTPLVLKHPGHSSIARVEMV